MGAGIRRNSCWSPSKNLTERTAKRAVFSGEPQKGQEESKGEERGKLLLQKEPRDRESGREASCSWAARNSSVWH